MIIVADTDIGIISIPPPWGKCSCYTITVMSIPHVKAVLVPVLFYNLTLKFFVLTVTQGGKHKVLNYVILFYQNIVKHLFPCIFFPKAKSLKASLNDFTASVKIQKVLKT